MRIRNRLRIGVAGACTAIALGLPAVAAAGETVTQAFTATDEHEFVVAPGVTSLQMTLIGGNGAPGNGGFPGGTGATVTASLTVSPGEVLYAEVAGNGTVSATSDPSLGGYGGGGNGGDRRFFGTFLGGGGGGGASDVRSCPLSTCTVATSLASRLVIAAGGGGGGGAGYSSSGTPSGGSGGGAEFSGGKGVADSKNDPGGGGGVHGTPSAGGTAGEPSQNCEMAFDVGCAIVGATGEGGGGGQGLGTGGLGGGGGGGGGGGLFGGGGGGGGGGSFEEPSPSNYVLYNGGGGGGGGGASGVPSGVAAVSGYTLSPTVEAAIPSVKFSWIAPAPTVITEAAIATSATTATLNGTVNPNAWQLTGCGFSVSPAPAGISTFPCTQQLGAGSTVASVSATAAGLAPGTTYTATLVAGSIQGSTSGAPVIFTTPPAGGLNGPPPTTPGAGPPTVTDLKLSPSTFRRGKHSATLANTKTKRKALPTVTTISFQLSAAATVTISFEKSLSGVTVGHKCVAPSKARHKGRGCKRYATVHGSVVRTAPAGLEEIRFEGILDGNKPLPAGAYRLSLKASVAAASTTAAQHPTFELLTA